MCRNRATLCRTSSSSPCLPLPLMGVIRRRQDTPLSKTLSHFMYRLVRSLYYHRIDFPVSIRAVESCFNIILDSLVAYDFPEQKSIPFVTQGNRLYTNTQTHTHIYIYINMVCTGCTAYVPLSYLHIVPCLCWALRCLAAPNHKVQGCAMNHKQVRQNEPSAQRPC